MFLCKCAALLQIEMSGLQSQQNFRKDVFIRQFEEINSHGLARGVLPAFVLLRYKASKIYILNFHSFLC